MLPVHCVIGDHQQSFVFDVIAAEYIPGLYLFHYQYFSEYPARDHSKKTHDGLCRIDPLFCSGCFFNDPYF
jgi:hypothetical protein